MHKWDLTGTAIFLVIFLLQLLIFFYRIKILNFLSLNLFPRFFFSPYSMEPAIVVCLVIAFIFWLIRLARIVVHFFKLMEIRAFYKNALRITEVITGISSVIWIIMIVIFFFCIYRASDISRKKKQNFAGFLGAKLRKNRPISQDFSGRKVKIRRKIGRFRRILAEKSQITKDFQGQILRKISRFHGKFRGETSPRNNQ